MAEQNEALPVLKRYDIFAYSVADVPCTWEEDEAELGDWVRYKDATAALQELRAEVERLKADAERWRVCEKARLFPEFCSHLATGNGWYMPTYPLRQPPIFQTPGEAADEYREIAARQPGAPGAKD